MCLNEGVAAEALAHATEPLVPGVPPFVALADSFFRYTFTLNR